MFLSFKDRKLPSPGDLVRVYRNLPKPPYYSIRAEEGDSKGLVLGHAKAVIIEDVKFLVGEKSRKTVLKNGVRGVHAYALGRFVGVCDEPPADFLTKESVQVTYQPFVHGHFFERSAPLTPVTESKQCCMFGPDCLIP
jgi:hypothetical protein|tara:strand:- start:2494 stop:2907 length:414 start_codon:yes stop_codon:yes gene_type:complete